MEWSWSKQTNERTNERTNILSTSANNDVDWCCVSVFHNELPVYIHDQQRPCKQQTSMILMMKTMMMMVMMMTMTMMVMMMTTTVMVMMTMMMMTTTVMVTMTTTTVIVMMTTTFYCLTTWYLLVIVVTLSSLTTFAPGKSWLRATSSLRSDVAWPFTWSRVTLSMETRMSRLPITLPKWDSTYLKYDEALNELVMNDGEADQSGLRLK